MLQDFGGNNGVYKVLAQGLGLLMFQYKWGVPGVAGPELCPHGLCWGQLSQLLFTGRREISHPWPNQGLQGGIKPPGVQSPVGMLIPAAGAAPLPSAAHPLCPWDPSPGWERALPGAASTDRWGTAPLCSGQMIPGGTETWQGNVPVTAAQPPPARPSLVFPTAGS